MRGWIYEIATRAFDKAARYAVRRAKRYSERKQEEENRKAFEAQLAKLERKTSEIVDKLERFERETLR